MPVFTGCPLLEEFKLDGQCPTDRGLFALGSSCPRLRSIKLNFSGKPAFSDSGLKVLSRGCPVLTDLSLHDAPNITDTAVLSFAEQCRKLVSLRITSQRITSRAVCTLLKVNPNLRGISLGGDLLVRGEVALTLALHCHKALFIRLLVCSHLTEAMLATLFTRCTRLEALSLVIACSITLHCKSLDDVDLRSCPKLTGLTLSHLFRFGKRLTRIYMENCGLYTSDEPGRYYTAGPNKTHGLPFGDDKPFVDLFRATWSTSWAPPLTPLLVAQSSTSCK